MSELMLHDEAVFTMRDAAISECERLAMRCTKQAADIAYWTEYSDNMRKRAMAAEEELEKIRRPLSNKVRSTIAVVLGLLIVGAVIWGIYAY